MIASEPPRFRRRAAILLLAALVGGFGPFLAFPILSRGAAAAPACQTTAPPPPAFNESRGVRTKWLSLARDERNTVEPDLAGLPLNQWMANLEAAGVNLAEINLEPSGKLAVRPFLPDSDLMQAVGAIYSPPSKWSDADRARVAEIEHDIVPNYRYTPAQRNAIQLDFLRRLEELRQRGEIAGSVRFFVHQRLWFREVHNRKTAAKYQEHAAEFIADMASFVRLAESNCLGHWIAGIRLGEHSNNDMNELLPLLVELAGGINARTDGWLKTHLLLANGGGWGAEYRGIDRIAGADGQPYPFLARIAAETGGFAFGYKWMQFHDQAGRGIVGHILAAQCGPARGCDANSVADWESYLGSMLGFNDLIAYIAANRDQYPRHANVVFVGDSSDSLNGLVRIGADGRLVDSPALIALRHLFIRGSTGFYGRVFMNGYATAETMRRNGEGGAIDTGRSLYFIDGAGKARLLPESKRLWDRWPQG
jgi:hypothetical protein